MSERYSFSLTTFNPSGKLVQIEYALNAVNAGQPAVGIKAKVSVVHSRIKINFLLCLNVKSLIKGWSSHRHGKETQVCTSR